MFGGSGFQSQHIITAFIWFINCQQVYIDKRTLVKWLENTQMSSSSWRVPPRLFRSHSAGFLRELQCFALMPALLHSVWMTHSRELANYHCCDNAASLCERAYWFKLIYTLTRQTRVEEALCTHHWHAFPPLLQMNLTWLRLSLCFIPSLQLSFLFFLFSPPHPFQH